MNLPFCEPYKIKTVEMIRKTTRKHREQKIKEAKYNLFNLKSDDVFIDLLTDSGTGAMSDKQWAEIMLGDESYAGARSYYRMKGAIRNILGFDYFLPTHQGRAAENVLFSTLIKAGDIIPGNSHFDTTKAHIEFRKAHAVDCTIDEAFDTTLEHPFKGNIDLHKLEIQFKTNPIEKIPAVVLTITCNSSGGQPVAMENIRQVATMCRKYGTRLIFDSARFAENAYFIKMREAGYQKLTVKQIVREMFSYADLMTMSSKKDAIVNIGGFIAFRDVEILRQAQVYNIMFEGFNTYGGLSGRDMGALAQGLDEGTEFAYLDARIGQVHYLGDKIRSYGITIQEPPGGHAIFIDALKFLPHLDRREFVAQTLGVELYIEGGVRAVEIGTLLADRDPATKLNRCPMLELLRLAIPRRVYTNNHMDYIAAALGAVWKRRNKIKRGFKILYEAPFMRHFTVELERYTPDDSARD